MNGRDSVTKVLVVENSKLKRDKIVNYIKSTDKKLKIFSAPSAMKALAITSKEVPNFAFINQVLPDEKGTELIKEMKRRGSDTYFILMTDSNHDEIYNDEVFQSVDDVIYFQKMDEVFKGINIALHHYKKYKAVQMREEKQLKARTAELIKVNECLKKKVNERTWAIEVLRNSLNKYRNLVETSNDMIFSVDLQGNFKFANEAVQKHLGYSEEEIKRLNGFELVHPDDLQSVLDRFLELPEGKLVNDLEYRYKTKNGTYINILNNAAPIFDSEGNITGAFGIARNITDRKKVEEELKKAHDELEMRVKERTTELEKVNKALKTEIEEHKRSEEALRKSEEKFRQFFENEPEYCYMISPDGIILDLNHSALKALGYKKKELVGKPINTIYAPESHPKMEMLFNRWKKKGKLKNEELVILTKKGEKRTILLSASTIKDDQGKIITSVSVQRDLTEYKRAKEALQQSEERYQTIFNKSPDYIYLTDTEGKILDANEALLEKVGLSLEEFKKIDLISFYAGDNIDDIYEVISKILDGQEVKELEVRVKIPQNKFLDLEINCIPLKENGKVTKVINLARDITERKLAQEKIRQQNELLSSTLESLTHPFYVINAKDYSIEIANSAAQPKGRPENMTCYSLTHNRTKRCSTKNHPCPIEEIKRKKVPITVEHIHYDKDGNKRNIEVNAYPIFDSKGNVEKIIEYSLDITERKRAEEGLKESEEQFRNLTDLLPEGVFEIDLNGNFTFANKKALEMSGYTRSELESGLNAFQMFIPDEQKHVKKNISRILTGRDIGSQEYIAIKKDGTKYPVLIHSNAIFQDNKPKGLRGIIIDITERKKVEEALRTSEEKLRRIFESVTDGIVITDLDGNIIEVNEKGIELGGHRSKNELIGKNSIESIASYDQERALDNMMELFEKKVVGTAEFNLLKADGSEYPTEISANVLKDDLGNPVGFVSVIRDITERKRADKVLRKSEEKYRSLVEEISDVIFSVDKNGIITYMSPAVESLTGYKKSEIIGQPFFKFLYKEDLTRVKDGFKDTLSGNPKPNEYRGVKKSGEIYWIRTYSQPIIEDGKIIGARGLIADITERKLAEEAVHESENRYRSLFEKSSASITLVDQAGIVIDCNESTEKLIGYSKVEIIGKSFQNLMTLDPKDLPKLMEKFQKLLQGQDIEPYELEIIRKDGKRRWIIVRNSLLKKDDNVVGFQIISTDITERKHAEMALENKLRESEHLYQLSEELKYSDTIDDVSKKGLVSICSGFEFEKGLFFLLDENLEYLTLTQSFGLKKGKGPIKISVWENDNLLRRSAFENKWFSVQKNKLTSTKGKVVLPKVLKEKLHFPKKSDSFFVAPVNSKNKVIGVIILDVSSYDNLSQESTEMLGMYLTAIGTATENVMLYQQLEKSYENLKEIDKIRTEFIDIASHELRTPLASIKIYTDLMRDGFIGNFSKNEKCQLMDMNNNIDSLNKLIDDMLDFSRTEKDFSKLKLKDMELTRIANEVVNSFISVAKARNIDLKVNYKGNAKAKLDRQMMRKVFSNLISNAIKYSHDGGSVTVNVSEKDNHSMVSIEDSGVGISNKDLPHIFDRFYMGDTSLTRERDQLGLGLSITKAIVEGHGGKIWAESEVGKGSTITFSIPKKLIKKDVKRNKSKSQKQQ